MSLRIGPERSSAATTSASARRPCSSSCAAATAPSTRPSTIEASSSEPIRRRCSRSAVSFSTSRATIVATCCSNASDGSSSPRGTTTSSAARVDGTGTASANRPAPCSRSTAGGARAARRELGEERGAHGRGGQRARPGTAPRRRARPRAGRTPTRPRRPRSAAPPRDLRSPPGARGRTCAPCARAAPAPRAGSRSRPPARSPPTAPRRRSTRRGSRARSAHASISGSSGGALMSSPIATATSPSALMRSTNAACSAAPAGTGNPVVITRSPCPSHSHGAASSQACAHATCRPAPAWPATTRVLSSGSATSSATVMPIALSVGDAAPCRAVSRRGSGGAPASGRLRVDLERVGEHDPVGLGGALARDDLVAHVLRDHATGRARAGRPSRRLRRSRTRTTRPA